MSYTIQQSYSAQKDNKEGRVKNLRVKLISLAIFCLLTLTTVFTFFSVSTNQSFDKYVQSMNSGEYTNAIVHLEAFSRVFQSKYSKFNAKDSVNLPMANERKDFVMGLIKIIYQLNGDEHEEQKQALLALKKYIYDINKLTTGVTGYHSKFKSYLRKEYDTLVDSFKKLRRNEIIGPFKKKENQNRIYQQSILAQDLANEFGTLMGLSPLTLRGPNDQTQFYKSGILKGLPVLNRLPDDIRGLIDLKKKLDEAGGEVSLRGREDTPTLFKNKLAEIRRKCNVFSSQISKLQQDTDDYSADTEKLEDEFMKEAAKFSLETKNFLIDYVRPD